MPEPIFTRPDAWNGGHYETWFLYEVGDDLDAAVAAVWSFGRITAGPVLRHDVEPWEQTPVDPSSAPGGGLHGLVDIGGGVDTICHTSLLATDAFADDPQLMFTLPLGALGVAWPEVGSFPFGVTEDEIADWEPRLEEFLFDLASHVYPRAPFRRAVTGYEGMLSDPLAEGPIPPERGAGVIEPIGGHLAWFPPTGRGGFEFH